MKKTYAFIFTLLCFMTVAGVKNVNASHMMGSDMKWKCLGNDSFLVTLYVYRDCNGIDLQPPSFTIQGDCQSSSTTISGTIGSRKDITPVCEGGCTRCSNSGCEFQYGIEQFTVNVVLYLPPPCCTYKVSFEQSARNTAITTGAAGQDFYIEETINRCIKPCVNSPYFTNPPVAMFCKGRCVVYNMGGNDDDNSDSLSFNFTQPLSGPGQAIPYNSGYSDSTPLKFNGTVKDTFDPVFCKGFHMDHQTGELQFKPMQEDITVLAVAVTAWRKDSTGKPFKVSEIRRDIEVIIIDCPTDRPPVVSGIDGTNLTVSHFCVGQGKCFTVSSFDPDIPDSVFLSWNNQIKGATFSVPDNHKKKWPKGTFCWTPGKGDLRPYPYRFVVTGTDNACNPIPSLTTKTFTIYVHPSPEVKDKHVVKDCGAVDFTALNIGTTTVDQWIWSSQNGSPALRSTNTSVSWKFQDTGWIHFTLTGINNATGCQGSYKDSVFIAPYVQVHLPKDTVVCKGSVIPLISSRRALGKSPYYYEWSTGLKGYDQASVKSDTIRSTQHLWVKITDGTGCVNYDTMVIYSKNPPAPKLGTDIRRCMGETVTLHTHITEKVGHSEWYLVNKSSSTLVGYTTKGDSLQVKVEGLYKVRVVDTVGCDGWDSIHVYFNPLVKVLNHDEHACTGTPYTLHAKAGEGADSVVWIDLRHNTKVWPVTALDKDSLFVLQNPSPAGTPPNPSQPIQYQVLAWGKRIGGVRCQSVGYVNLYVNDPPVITFTAKPLPKQCIDNGPMNLSGYATPVGGKWSSKTQSSAVSNNYAILSGPTGLGKGTHYLTYTYTDPKTKCVKSDSVSLLINDIPSITMPADIVMCSASGKVELSASPSGGAWTGATPKDQARLLSQGTHTYFVPDTLSTASYRSLYRLIYTYKNNSSLCDASDGMYVTVYKTPVVKAGSYGPFCSSEGSKPLSGSPQNGLWQVISGPKATLTGDTVNGFFFNPQQAGALPGQGQVKVTLSYTVTNQGHCPVTDTTTVTVNPLPKISFALPGKLCESNGVVNLGATPQGGSYSGSAGLNGSQFDPQAAGVGPHTITYTYRDPSTGCENSLSQSLEVTPKPTAQILSSASQCEGSFYHIEVKTTSSGTLNWDESKAGSGHFVNEKFDTVTQRGSADYYPSQDDKLNNSFTVYVSAQAKSGSACADAQASLVFTINPRPHVAFKDVPAKGCAPLSVQFTDQSTVRDRTTDIASRLWVFGDGDSSTETNPVHIYKKAGFYTVSLTIISTDGCDSTLTKNNEINVYLTPKPDFGAKPQYTSISLPKIQFINETTDTLAGVSYEWSFGDRLTAGGGTSQERDPEYTYKDTGRYTVRLIASNKNGCKDTMTKEKYIYIQPELIVFVPNVFTPNGLGTEYNERFMVQVSAYSTYQIDIYNRWGELMYEGKDPKEGWDGKYKGQAAEEGVYVYVIKASDLNGKQYKYNGTVTILR
jgi:gliding motility-associated-like protein